MVSGNFSIEDVKKKLIDKSLRVTQQRIVILKNLLHRNDHPTAEDIYEDLKDDYPSMSLATVYKTLDTFDSHGLVKKIKGSSDSVHYDADVTFHHHLICTKTNRIQDLIDEKFSRMINNYLKSNNIDNFEIHDIQLNIFGEITDQVNSQK